MKKKFTPLPTVSLAEDSSYYKPVLHASRPVTPDDQAIHVMTHFRNVVAVTIQPEATIDEANETMISHGVRLLLVTNPENIIAGVITASDILGEKPMLHLKDFGGKREDIKVSDIMMSAEEINVLRLSDVLSAKVGNIVETLEEAGHQHLLVVESGNGAAQQTVCGIFSATQIGKQLGVPIEPANIARTFAELEKVINK